MAFREACRSGTVLTDELIIDAHAHMGPWLNFHIADQGSPASMVKTMDACGVDVTIISPHICIGPEYRLGNRHAYEAAAEFPGRLIPFVTVNPNYPIAEIEDEIAHWESNGGITAFKLHPSLHQYKASGEGYFPVYEYANAHKLPILSHSWAGDPLGGASTLGGLAEKYPNAAFIIGHSASSWQVLDEASREANAHNNVYLDLTGSRLIRGLLEDAVQRVGADRVLFGTDNPFIDPRPGLGRVLMADLSDDDKRLILGLNAKQLFRL